MTQEDQEAISLLYTADETAFLNVVLQEKSLNSQPFITGRLSAITSKNNPEAQYLNTISIYDFLKKDLVLYSTQTLENDFFYQFLCTYGKPNIAYKVNNSMFVSTLLQKDDYWSLGKLNSNTQDKLIALPFQENIAIHSYLIYNQSAAESFIIQQFVQLTNKLKSTFSESYIINE